MSSGTSYALAVVNVLKTIALVASPGQRRAAELYGLVGSSAAVGERSLYVNLGYWESATTYDAACEHLAMRLAEAATLAPGHEVLDVGFGFGDQDIHWAREFEPLRIVGLNVTAMQVERARRRVEEAGLSTAVDLRLGSGTDMPCPDASFDRVTALESAFHFSTRETFMHEAFRVLRPGGRVAVADIIARDGSRLGSRKALGLALARRAWQMPRENYYDANVYQRKLEDAGFTSVNMRSIRDRVFAQSTEYFHRRLDEPEIVDRLHPLQRWIQRRFLPDERTFAPFDYVLVTADKPGGDDSVSTCL